MTESLLGLIAFGGQPVAFLVGLRATEEAPGILPTFSLWGILLGIIFLVVAGMVAAVVLYFAMKRHSPILSAVGIGLLAVPLALVGVFVIFLSLQPGNELLAGLTGPTATPSPLGGISPPAIPSEVSMPSLASTAGQLHVDPAAASYGVRMSVTGSGWQPGELVKLEYAYPDGTRASGGQAAADAEGNLDPSDWVPVEGDPPGTYVLTATGSESGSALATFEVIRDAVPSPTVTTAPPAVPTQTQTSVPPTTTQVPTIPPTKAPIPTATLVPPPSPTAPPAPAGCPGPWGDLLFYDDFGDHHSGWTEEYGDDYEHFYSEDRPGEFGFEVWRTNFTGNAWMQLDGLGTHYRMEVQAWKEGGPDMNNYGLIFGGRDDVNYHAFRISDSGSYRIAKKVDGQWVELITWTKTPAVNKGGLNVLSLLVEGTKITVCVNGQVLASVNDPALELGRVGMVAGAYDEPVHIHFDNFGVWHLE